MGSTHLKALRGLAGVDLAAVYSSDDRKLAGDLTAIQGNLGGAGEYLDFSGVAKYREIEPLLASREIDAVDICLPTDLHAAVAIEALRAGKHVLVEKPMALDGVSADAMSAEARTRGRILMTAQVLRFSPAYAILRDAVRSGNIGPVRHAFFRRRCAAPAWSRWLGDPDRSGGGVFDLLIHDVDICLHLFGMPEAVAATGYAALESGIDIIAAELHYAGRGAVLIAGGWHHPRSYPFSMEYTVVADNGTIEYSSAGGGPMLYKLNGDAEQLSMPAHDGYQAEIEYFAACCNTGQQPDLCPPEESACAVKLMRLMLEARNANGERIACKL